ncbi:hypothetical protein R1sor_010555 [Riccia sorocarpa]|uniref:DNA methylase N-4/N-6 domain-containing protein n=1 Tax=Riccia sorocarpa TaxID=122646 RepID=A0ABD3I1S8_9MARC
MALAKPKLFTIEDIVNSTNIRKSKLRWFLREAINVYGARSLFLASAKKEPVNIGIVAWLGIENDTVDVLLEALELAIVDDSKWIFIERDCVKLALRLGILSPPEGVVVADVVPHNVKWAAFKDKQEREKKKKGVQTQRPPAVDVGQPSEISPNADRAKKKKQDVGGPPEYMVPDNTPVEDSAADVSFPVTQSPKIQPLSAMSEVEMDKNEKNRIRREAIIRCLVDHKSFVNELKKHMQTNAYAHYHNFILLVDPRDCPDKTKWVFPPPSTWRFYVIGGLTKSDAALFAHDDNFDAEVRRKYTYHQRVEYFHRQFMEAKQTGESLASLRKRLALETMNISEEDSKTALSTLEGTFQVAFRTGKLWDVQESIFQKFERKELKSMKAAGKGKKKDDGEMRPTWWRALQSISDERKLSILLRVDAGELALDQMSAECERCRTLDVIMKAFCHLTRCPNWEDAQAKCGPNASDERLYSFEKSFDLMLVLPTEFLDHIDSAREYKEAKEQGRDAPQPVQTFKTWAKEGSLKSVEWDVFHHDVILSDGKPANIYQKSQTVINKLLHYFSREDDWVLDLCSGSGTTLVCALQGGRNCVAVELDKRQYLFLASRVYNMKKLPDANTEVTRSHKHSSDVGPPQKDGEAEVNEVAHEIEDDDAIILHNDDGVGSIGTQEDEHGSANEEELEELPAQSEGGEANLVPEDADSAPLVVGDSLSADPIETDP